MAERAVIIRDPDILGGTPVFRHTRVPVQTLLDYLAADQTLDEFLADFPSVQREQALAVLAQFKRYISEQPYESAA
jgi:uncharacterized protein (DUF433 family)